MVVDAERTRQLEQEIAELLDNFHTVDREFDEKKAVDTETRDRIDDIQEQKVYYPFE
jgi:septal ring factor EnvC (AmiA/AmiB activator)